MFTSYASQYTLILCSKDGSICN